MKYTKSSILYFMALLSEDLNWALTCLLRGTLQLKKDVKKGTGFYIECKREKCHEKALFQPSTLCGTPLMDAPSSWNISALFSNKTIRVEQRVHPHSPSA